MMSIDKNEIKIIFEYLKVLTNKDVELSLLQKYIILYEIKTWNDLLKIIELKQVSEMLSAIDDINLETIVKLANPKPKDDKVYGSIFIERSILENSNNLEQTIRDNIKTNRYMLFYYTIRNAEAKKFHPSCSKYYNVIIKIKTKKPIYFRDYFKDNDIFKEYIHYFLKNDVIDFLTDDYTICSLEQVKDDIKLCNFDDSDERLKYLQNNINGKDYFPGERKFEWE